MALKQLLILLLVSTAVGLAVNAVSPNSIDLIGEYRELSSGDGPVIPPTAAPGDPPFIDINQARMEFNLGTALFVDARDPSEFECGTIPGSVNLPFEWLPEEGVERYVDSILNGAPRSQPLVIFCSGEECDLSLHLGRNMIDFGYDQILVFFGGSREWETLGFDVERRVECDN